MANTYLVSAYCGTQQGHSVSLDLAMEIGDGLSGPTDDLAKAIRDSVKTLVGTYTSENVSGIDYAHDPTASAEETGLTRTLT